jgi:hypothetical protein
LLWALRRLKCTTDFLISIETLDDVTFEPRELPLQSSSKPRIIGAERPP